MSPKDRRSPLRRDGQPPRPRGPPHFRRRRPRRGGLPPRGGPLRGCVAGAADRARELIEKPRRARVRFAPSFSSRTLEGEALSLESLGGKVALIDFWATWCAPCRAAIPEIKDLRRKYPADRLAIVSFSADGDEQALRRFVAEKDMSWTQCDDAEGAVRKAFGVDTFPTYVVLDGEGAILTKLEGTDPHRSIGYRLREALGPLLAQRRP
jgi:thiol-disulfide isomerase/thioredoxin